MELYENAQAITQARRVCFAPRGTRAYMTKEGGIGFAPFLALRNGSASLNEAAAEAHAMAQIPADGWGWIEAR